MIKLLLVVCCVAYSANLYVFSLNPLTIGFLAVGKRKIFSIDNEVGGRVHLSQVWVCGKFRDEIRSLIDQNIFYPDLLHSRRRKIKVRVEIPGKKMEKQVQVCTFFPVWIESNLFDPSCRSMTVTT